MWATSWQSQENGMCAQQRLRSAWASAQYDQSSLFTWRKLGSLAAHWADSEDSDQTGRMPRLIWVFAWCTVILLVLSWGGSYTESYCCWDEISKICLMTKPTKWHVRPVKTQISLGILPVWSVFAFRIKKAWIFSYPLSTQRSLWSD